MAEDPAELVIDERFVVATRRPTAPIGGIDAFEVADRHGGGRLAALRVAHDVSPRRRESAFARPFPGLIPPIATHVSAAARWFVVERASAPALDDPSIRSMPWNEAQIVAGLIRPVAASLAALQAQGLTHREIRADNVFGSLDNPATLGPCWARGAGWGQDARAESPWVAVCPPPARGEGSIADDVYALGALALALHIGERPMPGLSDAAVIERKLELGSFRAMLGDQRIASGLADLLRAMLADDPDQRPAPAALAEVAPGRERRSMRRVAPRAPRPIEIGTCVAWNLPMLALAIGREPHEGLRLLRTGAVSHWLRRAAEAPLVATRLDEALQAAASAAGRDGADGLVALRAIAIFDPTAPLFWEGRFFWPDSVGSVLHAAVLSRDAAPIESVRRAIRSDAFGCWARATGRPASLVDPGGWLQTARGWRAEAGADPVLRLFYALDPAQPCRSPTLEAMRIVSPAAMIGAIETGLVDSRLSAEVSGSWIDGHVIAFLMARDDAASVRHDVDLGSRLAGLGDLIVLAGLQIRHRAGACPQLARTLLPDLRKALESHPGRSRRATISAQVEQHAARGDLRAMLAIVADERRTDVDRKAQAVAHERVAQLRLSLEKLTEDRQGFAARARHMAGEIGVGGGLLALAGVAFAMFVI